MPPRSAAAAMQHSAHKLGVLPNVLLAALLAILWSLLATVVPVNAQFPCWFGLVIISTVLFSRIVLQLSERQQAKELQQQALSTVLSGPAAPKPPAIFPHQETSLLALLSTPGPFQQGAATAPAAGIHSDQEKPCNVAYALSVTYTTGEVDAVTACESGLDSCRSKASSSNVQAFHTQQSIETTQACSSNEKPVGTLSTKGQANSFLTSVKGLGSMIRSASSSVLAQLNSIAPENTKTLSDPQVRQHLYHQQQQQQSSSRIIRSNNSSDDDLAERSKLTVNHCLHGAEDKLDMRFSNLSASLPSQVCNLVLPSIVWTWPAWNHGANRPCPALAAANATPSYFQTPGSDPQKPSNNSNMGGGLQASWFSSVPESGESSRLSLRSSSACQAMCSYPLPNSSNIQGDGTQVISPRIPQALCIEDDELAQAMLQVVLSGLGWKVHHMLSGDEGLSFLKLATYLPDIVIISQDLQGSMDGMKVCSRIREHFSACKLTVVISMLDTDGSWVAAQALESGADGVLVKPYQGPEVLCKLLTLIADAAEVRLRNAAQEALMTSWESQGACGHPGWRQAPTGLLRTSSVPQAVGKARWAPVVTSSHGADWLAASSAQQQAQQGQQGVGAGSGNGRQQWEVLQQRDRERELEVEREWEEDSLNSIADHQADSWPRTLSRSRTSLGTSNGRAILHASRVCFTSGWAGKPVIADDDKEGGGPRGSRLSSAGDRKAEQLYTFHTVSSPGCREATIHRVHPQTVVKDPAAVMVEGPEAVSNMLSFRTYSAPLAGYTQVSPPHAKTGGDHRIGVATSLRAIQLTMPSGAQNLTFPGSFGSGFISDSLGGRKTGSLHSLDLDRHTFGETDPDVSDLNVTVDHATLASALTSTSISGVAELYTAASSATVPDGLCGPQAAPSHFVEFHQQRKQQQLAVPPPHQSQAVVMTSSFYTPSSCDA